MSVEKKNEKLPFEEALDKTGFGLYNFMVICIAGLNNISFTCMAFSASVNVPASACDLDTTTSQQGAMVAAPFIAVALSLLTTGGQVVSFASIQLINLLLVNNCELGFYLFASLFTLSTGILLLMPDDRLLPKLTETEEKF